jgi:hypothetical protein
MRRSVLTAGVALVLVAVPLASPAFAKDHPKPTLPSSSGKLQGGVAMGLSAPFGSFAPVEGRPADKPIGVPFESLSRAGGALIRIDNQDVPNTSDPNNFAIAVISRQTRAVVESGIVNKANTGMLGALAAKYSKGDDFLMVASGLHGIIGDAANTKAFTDAVRKLGGRDLTGEELALLKGGAAFSIVGVPGGDAGGAYISIDHGAAPHGGVFGYLQVNVANDRYGVVTADYPTYNTTNTSPNPGAMTVRFNRVQYGSRQLAAGESGFLVLTFDSSLRSTSNTTVVTNGTAEDRSAQDALNRVLSDATGSTPDRYGSTVVVRSIGHPTPVGEGWSDAAKLIEKLGGNRLAFNNLDAGGPETDYSLVGTLNSGAPAIESNPALGTSGPIAGSLSRNRDMVFTPVAGGTPMSVNTELVDITYQAAQEFPPYTDGAPGTTTNGTAAADAYIGRALKLCADAAIQPVCSVRTEFYSDYGAGNGFFIQASISLESGRFAYPGDGHGFTEADYTAVRRHLGEELAMVNMVRSYFTAIQKPFGEAAQSGTIDTKALTDALVAEVGAGRSGTTSFVLGLIGKIAALGGFAGPPVSAVAAGLSATFGLAAYLTQPSGPPQLATDVKVSADQLGDKARAQLLATSRSLNGLAMLVVSDYGKMKAVTDKEPTPLWRLPNDTGPALTQINLAVRQSAAEKLVPLVYPWLLRGTPERSAQSMSCREEIILQIFHEVNVWKDQPNNTTMYRERDYITRDGRSIPAPYWFAKPGADVDGDGVTPSAALGNLLFEPANASRNTLGINLYAFLSPRVFGTIHQANDAAYYCDLYKRPANGRS